MTLVAASLCVMLCHQLTIQLFPVKCLLKKGGKIHFRFLCQVLNCYADFKVDFKCFTIQIYHIILQSVQFNILCINESDGLTWVTQSSQCMLSPLPVCAFCCHGHMIACDRGHEGSSGVMSSILTSCKSNHLFIFLTTKLWSTLAEKERARRKRVSKWQ